MTTVLLFIFNFIVIIGLINLFSSKVSKYAINKFNITNDTIDHLKKILIRFVIIIIPLNLLFSPIIFSICSSTITVIIISITVIVDGICVICLTSYSKLQKN
ncbi:hypothetical protein K2F40_05485 [Clostridium sp. CM028]|uniref:hypothetical protein n=1 Tax=unclassified Clostridium TaxID=2614128 RepID=UPI001C0BF923|nr:MULTISPECIES: hypothetical protein [unclassified Clostridium]MBU3091456.1 hypothetical protein [Clostridium sp. CF011]MBW9148426.1 hypothetical protein [Clostridium sp. CM028]WAG69265.1 hypothetical protein LL036_14860 [Clostridium sp. CF011]WLC60999.1 hypothetical protein KTC94_12885 [Clostridium sp. CM028]